MTVAVTAEPAQPQPQQYCKTNGNLWPTVEHSEIGEVAVDGNPVHFSESDWGMHSGAPCLGEDNQKVFTEILGLSKEEIETLKQEKVI